MPGGGVYLNVAATVLRNLRGDIVAAIESIRDITDRKRMEESLRMSELRLLDAMDLMDLIPWEYEPATKLFTFNNRFYALCGTTAEREGGYLIPADVYIHEFLLPEDALIVEVGIKKAQDSTDLNYVSRYEYRIVRRDGHIRHVANRLHVVRDSAGKTMKYYGVTQDITEQKKLEESLLASESRLAAAMDLAQLAYWEYDVTAGNFTVNDRFFSLYATSADKEGGYLMTPDEYASRFIHPEDVHICQEEIHRAVSSTDPHYSRQFEHRVVRRDSELRHLAMRVNMAEFADGRPVKFYGTNQDITERKRAEEAIKQSLSLLQATLESTTDGILVVDTSGSITGFNERFSQLWHIPQAILDSRDDGQAIEFVLSQLKYPEQFVAKVKELYARPEAESFDMLEFKDGRIFERYSRPQMLDGKPAGRVWSFRNVTEQRQAQEELKQRETALASILRAAPIGIGAVRDRVLLQVNQKLCEMTGYSAEELIGQKARILYSTQEEYEWVGKEKYRQIAEHGTGTVETRWRRKDGQVINILLSSTLMHSGDVAGEVTFTAIDITGRKEIEGKLRTMGDGKVVV